MLKFEMKIIFVLIIYEKIIKDAISYSEDVPFTANF